MSETYTTASFVAAVSEAQAIHERMRAWLHAELTAAGLEPGIKPCAVTPDVEWIGEAWTVVGSRSWCGDSRLSGSKSLLVVVRAHEVAIFCQSYSGHTTHGRGRGQTVAQAVADLLAQPKNGVPQAFLTQPRPGTPNP